MILLIAKMLAKSRSKGRTWFSGIKWAEDYVAKNPNTGLKLVEISCFPCTDSFDLGAIEYCRHYKKLLRVKEDVKAKKERLFY